MRLVAVLILLAVAGCSSPKYHELAQTKKSDPIWQLNEGKWAFNENALTTPPEHR